MVSKDQIKDLQRTVEKLEEKCQDRDLVKMEGRYKDILEELRGQLEAFPKDLQNL